MRTLPSPSVRSLLLPLLLASLPAVLVATGPAFAETTCSDDVGALRHRLNKVGSSLPAAVVARATESLKQAAAADKKGDGTGCREAYKRASFQAGM